MNPKISHKILLVEDDDLTAMLVLRMFPENFHVQRAKNFLEVSSLIENDTQNFFLAFVDLDLDYDLEGLDILKYLIEKNVKSVILSARKDKTIIENAFRIGAKEFLQKPLAPEMLNEILHSEELLKDNSQTLDRYQNLFYPISSHNQSQHHTTEEVFRALVSPMNVLIVGETGVGKTKLVKDFFKIWFNHQTHQTHQTQHEKNNTNGFSEKPKLIEVNCSEFSESLLESELFGHVKGAFTGAIKDKKGLFEEANNGVLFLDEIGTMSLNMQMKILKTIEEQSFHAVGDHKLKKVKFKLITATCDDLSKKVKRGEMREDFFQRINGFKVELKPLRERKEDIEKIIEEYILKIRRNIIFTTEAIELMKQESWRGNVRELQHFLDRLFLSDVRLIDDVFVKQFLHDKESSEFELKSDLIGHLDIRGTIDDSVQKVGLNQFIEQWEKDIVQYFLVKNHNKIRKTLDDLKISSSAFYRIMGKDYEK